MRQFFLFVALPLVTLLVLCAGSSLCYADEERHGHDEGVQLFVPLVTKEVMPETKVEFGIEYTRERGHESELESEIAFQYAFNHRFSLELEVPFVFLFPEEERDRGGIGDVGLALKYLFVNSEERGFFLSGGIEAGFPTGSRRRELGGVTEIGPFVALAKSFGPFNLLGSISYSQQLNRFGDEPRERVLNYNLAAGYIIGDRWAPFLEFNGVNQLQGDKVGNRILLTPGIWVEALEGLNIIAGVQFPVTKLRDFFWRGLLGIEIEF